MIFLDIDGVLNRERTEERIGAYVGLDRELVLRFKRVLRETGADVVLTSTWRLEPAMHAAVRAEIRLVGITDDRPGTRGEQIARWLAREMQYDRHAVLDDASDMVDSLTVFPTELRLGLTQRIADAVVDHLSPQAWVHVAPGGSCGNTPLEGRGSSNEACGLAPGTHGPLDHRYLPPMVEMDHEAVPG